ncbi:MAG: polyphosphate polymerase domain-containing protein [Lachnoclostridium sp.]|nr:polyphosphate polymerase domain-containing protein [Lachnospira sp.]MCM1246979.1 polyphosphate polymerase domain-containing protein [Lachnoclostridium sp.]MCM1535032.1 polyphosphate polymerase domain-containing protein [Clostridium sp.]
MSEQMTFKRYEIKYLITKPQMAVIQNAISEHMIADSHGQNTLCSLYFDTPDYLLVRRSLEHPVYKEKLRLRSYGIADNKDTVFVELKKKYHSVVYKRRAAMSAAQAYDYLLRGKPAMDSQIIREINYFLQVYPGIRPAVLLTYKRDAYYGKDDHEFRITFDDHLLWRDYDLNLESGIYGEPLLDPNYVLMEVKVAEAFPLWFVRLLSENHIYKTHFSKYGAAYTAIYQNQQKGGVFRYA